MMKKILLLTTVCPTPLSDGKKVVLNGLMSYLIERYGADQITWGLVSNDTRGWKELMNFGIKGRIIRPPSLLEKIGSILWRSFFTRSLSIQEALFVCTGLKDRVANVMGDVKPDIIVCDTIRMGRLIFGTDSRALRVLYLDDLFSIRYARMLDQISLGVSLGGSILGNFGAFLPKLASDLIRHSPLLQRLLLAFERGQVEKSELKVAGAFDIAALVNPDEAALLSSRTGKAIAELRPWLQISHVEPRTFDGRPTFVFMGSLNIPHNEVALLEFLRLSFAEVVRRIPAAQLLVIGSKPGERVVAECAKWHGRVTLAGFVPDVNQALASCCGMIVPLLFGSGVKLKVLDALARGVPIVSTSVGIEGVPVSHGRECYIENDIAKFGYWLEQLVDPSRNLEMSTVGQKLFDSYYGRTAVFANYASLLQDRRPVGSQPIGRNTEERLEAASS
jgi:glycosyltransferase involved in cell wall biosynthesis